ncbi:MAG: hypothetical protein OXQ89_09010 [Rhodospirillaceae bacterium]|nr:hypothetical protein [Rhodospirillaceae bacterium]
MPRVSDETLRKRLQDAQDAWDERQKANRARQRREKAQADALRDSLIVKMVWHEVGDDKDKLARLMAKMDAFLDDPKHRALFDLTPRSEASASPSSEGQPPLVDPSTT